MAPLLDRDDVDELFGVEPEPLPAEQKDTFTKSEDGPNLDTTTWYEALEGPAILL